MPTGNNRCRRSVGSEKIAIVHDWLTGMRGGEKVLESICELYPDADVLSLVHIPGSVSPVIERHPITTSFLQRFPKIDQKYRWCLPLMPMAVESLPMKSYDLVLSTSHCVAKGVRVGREAVHICYCHTPMRYIWDMFDQYFGKGRASPMVRNAMLAVRPFLRRWDVDTASRVDHFIANSEHVKKRIRRYYYRDAEVIHPPVEVERLAISEDPKNYYLIVSAFAPYKRIDLAIEAFNRLKLPLKIIGTGQERKKLEGMADANIEFLGWQPDEAVRSCYQNCKALIFPGEEDFGIAPVEAQAAGRPVIALGRGGALETVLDGETGLFFHEQSVEGLIEAVEKFEAVEGSFDPQVIRKNAERFSRERFEMEYKNFVEDKMRERR